MCLHDRKKSRQVVVKLFLLVPTTQLHLYLIQHPSINYPTQKAQGAVFNPNPLFSLYILKEVTGIFP